MAYSNSEQIFMDVLGGRSPSPGEQKQIDALLAILQRAGFMIDDPSNAAHITLLAWGWARETGRGEVITALHNHQQNTEAKFDAIRDAVDQTQSLVEQIRSLNNRPPPEINVEHLASALQQRMPAQASTVRLDLSILRDAFRESINKAWLVAIGLGLVIAFWTGTEWQQHVLSPQIIQLQQQNLQLVNKLADTHHAR